MTTQEKKDPRSEYDEDDSHDRELQLQGASGVVQHATPSRTGLAVWSPPTCEILVGMMVVWPLPVLQLMTSRSLCPLLYSRHVIFQTVTKL